MRTAGLKRGSAGVLLAGISDGYTANEMMRVALSDRATIVTAYGAGAEVALERNGLAGDFEMRRTTGLEHAAVAVGVADSNHLKHGVSSLKSFGILQNVGV